MRFLVWKASTHLIAENALLGIGFGAYDETFPLFRDPEEWEFTGQSTRANWAHNSVIHTLSETGVVGLGAFLWLLSACITLAWRRAFQQSDKVASVVFLSLASVIAGTFVNSMVGTNFHLPGNLFLLALYAALLEVDLRNAARSASTCVRPAIVLGATSILAALALLIGGWLIRPYQADQILAWGIRQHNSGNAREALRTFGRACKVYPPCKKARFHIGAVAAHVENHLLAANTYQPLAEKYPNDIRLHNNLGYALEKLEKYDSAEQAYLRAIQLNPTSTVTFENLGRCLVDKGSIQKGLEVLNYSIQRGSRDPATFVKAGDAAAVLEHFVEAAQYYDFALTRFPKNPTLWYNMGLYWQKAGRLRDAASCYQQAIKRNPSFGYAYNNLALCHILSKDFLSAIDVLKTGVGREPNNPEIHFNLALSYHAIGQEREAQRSLQKARALAPQNKNIQISPEELDKRLAELVR